MWIDDTQWADAESLQLLERVASRPDQRLMIVLAGRPATEHRWLATLDRLELGPLDAAAAHALLSSQTSAASLDPASVSRAIDEARGNAFLLEFFARHAGRDGERYEMKTALGAVIRALDADARTLFECIALAEHPLPLGCVGRVVADRARLRGHASRLSSDGLISIDELERVSPYHDAIRELASAALAPDTRRSRHEALDAALVVSGMPSAWRIPHLEGCGRRDTAGAISLAAAREASNRHAFEIAVAYYGKALALGDPAPSDRAPILDELARNLASAGRGREAAESYGAASAMYATLDQPEAALIMRQRSAIALLRSGAIDDGRTTLAAALRSMGESLPRRPMLASVIEAIRIAFSSRRVVAETIPSQLRMRLETLWTTATSLSSGPVARRERRDAALVRCALSAGEPRWTIRALALEAAFLAALGGRYRQRAQRRMAELRERLLGRPWHYEAAWMAATEGSTAWLSGEIQDCLAWTTAARDVSAAPRDERVRVRFARVIPVAGDGARGRPHRCPRLRRDPDRGVGVSWRRLLDVAVPAWSRHGILPRGISTRPRPRARRPCARDRSARWFADAGLSPGLVPRDARAVRAGRRARLSGAARRVAAAPARWDASSRGGGWRPALSARPLCGRVEAERDAAAQIRWLRRSTLAFAGAMADSLDAQLAALRGRDPLALAASSVARFDGLGLRPDRDALHRWSCGSAMLPIDRVYVPT